MTTDINIDDPLYASVRAVIVFSSEIWFHYTSDDQIIIRLSNRIAA